VDGPLILLEFAGNVAGHFVSWGFVSISDTRLCISSEIVFDSSCCLMQVLMIFLCSKCAHFCPVSKLLTLVCSLLRGLGPFA